MKPRKAEFVKSSEFNEAVDCEPSWINVIKPTVINTGSPGLTFLLQISAREFAICPLINTLESPLERNRSTDK